MSDTLEPTMDEETTEDTSMITAVPADQPKANIDYRVFPNFSLPRYTDTWSECRPLGAEMYNNETVEDGTYFDESVVIDDFNPGE